MSAHEDQGVDQLQDPGEQSPWRKRIALAIAVVFFLSAAARAFIPEPSTKTAGGENSAGFVAGSATDTGEPVQQDGLATALPYVTEGSFFALLGFALGYLSRTILKVGLIVLGGAFLLVQGLSYLEIVTVDWSRAVEVTNTLILNLKENQTWTEVLKDRLPTTGALVAGYALGFRR